MREHRGLYTHKCKAKGRIMHIDTRWGKCPFCNEGVKNTNWC